MLKILVPRRRFQRNKYGKYIRGYNIQKNSSLSLTKISICKDRLSSDFSTCGAKTFPMYITLGDKYLTVSKKSSDLSTSFGFCKKTTIIKKKFQISQNENISIQQNRTYKSNLFNFIENFPIENIITNCDLDLTSNHPPPSLSLPITYKYTNLWKFVEEIDGMEVCRCQKYLKIVTMKTPQCQI